MKLHLPKGLRTALLACVCATFASSAWGTVTVTPTEGDLAHDATNKTLTSTTTGGTVTVSDNEAVVIDVLKLGSLLNENGDVVITAEGGSSMTLGSNQNWGAIVEVNGSSTYWSNQCLVSDLTLNGNVNLSIENGGIYLGGSEVTVGQGATMSLQGVWTNGDATGSKVLVNGGTLTITDTKNFGVVLNGENDAISVTNGGSFNVATGNKVELRGQGSSITVSGADSSFTADYIGFFNTSTASTLTVSDGATFTLRNNIGANGVSSGGDPHMVYFLGGTLKTIDDDGWYVADGASVTFGAVTIDAANTGAITIEGATTFVGTVDNHGSLVLKGALTEPTDYTALTKERIAATDTTQNGFLGSNRYYLVKNEGDGSLTFSGTVADGSALVTTDTTAGLYYQVQDTTTYYVNTGDEENALKGTTVPELIVVNDGARLNFSGSYAGDIELSGTSFATHYGSMCMANNSSVSGTVTITETGAAITVWEGPATLNNLTLDGNLRYNGDLGNTADQKNWGGTLKITGDVSGTGSITVGSGTMDISGEFSAIGNIVVENGGTLKMSGETSLSSTVTNKGVLTLTGALTEPTDYTTLTKERIAATDTTQNGFLGSNRYYLVKNEGNGSLTFSGTVADGSALVTTDTTAGLYYQVQDTTTYYVNTGDVQNAHDGTTVPELIVVNAGGRATFTKNYAGELTISGSGKGTKVIGALCMGEGASIAGKTTISSEGASVALWSGQTGNLNNVVLQGDLTLNGTANGSFGSDWTGTLNVTGTVSGSGALAVTKGTLTIGNTATLNHTGGFEISDGTLKLLLANPGSHAVTMTGGEILMGGVTLDGNINLKSGENKITGDASTGANLDASVSGEGNLTLHGQQVLNVSGTISNTGTLTFTGSDKTNTAVNVKGTVNAGSVTVSSGNVTVESGASFTATELLVSGGKATVNGSLTLTTGVTVSGGATLAIKGGNGVSEAADGATTLARDIVAMELKANATLELTEGTLSFTTAEATSTVSLGIGEGSSALVGATGTYYTALSTVVDNTCYDAAYALIDISSWDAGAQEALVGGQSALFSNVGSLAGDTNRVLIKFGEGQIGLYQLALSDATSALGANNVYISANVVPEPTTATLSLLALAALAARRRRM